MVSMAPIGQPAEVVVWRGGKRTAAEGQGWRPRPDDRLRPIPRPSAATPRRDCSERPDRPALGLRFAMGLELKTLDESSARRSGSDLPGIAWRRRGHEDHARQPAGRRLKPLDVITAIDGHTVQLGRGGGQGVERRSEPAPLVTRSSSGWSRAGSSTGRSASRDQPTARGPASASGGGRDLSAAETACRRRPRSWPARRPEAAIAAFLTALARQGGDRRRARRRRRRPSASGWPPGSP